MHRKARRVTGVLVALAAASGGAVLAQATIAAGPNKLKFPEGWDKGVMYATVDRPDTKQYREFYTSAEAVKAAREGKPIPYGTVITLAAYAAKLDAEGKPVKDANGRFVKDKLVAVNSMQKGRASAPTSPRRSATATGSTSPSRPTARSTRRPI